jgi:16S rRNA (adenine1518-N6/adenine1519-N6)-dimethyltransferase
MDSKRQTVSFLRRRFDRLGFRPQSRLGQNFLIDLNLLDLIVRVADVQPTDVVLEIGGGTGSLTVRLAERAAAVVSVELDGQLAKLAAEQLRSSSNVTLLQQDALRNKNHLHPVVVDQVLEQLEDRNPADLKLVANLPYSVATPVISNLLASRIVPSTMTVTIQRELADRIVAPPGTKEYGSLAVWIQSQCSVAIIRDLSPSVFWPRPQVHSAILQMVLVPAKRAEIGDPVRFQRFVRGLFLHRRKFLRGALRGAFKELAKSDVDQAMQQLKLGPETRAERLSVPQILELAIACGMHSTDRPADVPR